MSDSVILRAPATSAAPALVLRPWGMEDVAALAGLFRDPALRRWTSSAVRDEADAVRWVRAQERGWAAGDRYAFAVLEARPDPAHGPLAGHVVLKAPGNPSAEVGYWTAAHARGRGVAPRALEALTGWAFDTLEADELELLHQVDNLASCRVAQKSRYELAGILPAAPPSFPLEGHEHIRRRDVASGA
ncbi:GNAT family N-acetyltransferase [Nonomuraea cypriaca]|uniref:GNAT family N-acetyltransferase n=1 Tax=Nonomuraea cypriaca TaxID=1187855 RepID=UPI001A9C33C3|nr:GNAT family N-acetyltransferase [Nonomuraea cypriaca]